MTSQMKVALIRKVRGSLLGLFFLTCYPLEFNNQALADVRSTGSGIKCLYCRWWFPSQYCFIRHEQVTAYGLASICSILTIMLLVADLAKAK